jgi:hypothetical protein
MNAVAGRFALVSALTLTAFSSGTPVSGQVDPTAVGFVGGYTGAAEKVDPPSLPIIGMWRINVEKSAPGRDRDPTMTVVYTAENGGIRHDVFDTYPPKVDNYRTVYHDDYHSYWFKLDGKNIYTDPQGPNGRGQTVGMWLVDRNTIFRERATKGVIDERVLYRVSPDGKTLAWTGFNSDRDSSHSVYDRVK